MCGSPGAANCTFGVKNAPLGFLFSFVCGVFFWYFRGLCCLGLPQPGFGLCFSAAVGWKGASPDPKNTLGNSRGALRGPLGCGGVPRTANKARGSLCCAAFFYYYYYRFFLLLSPPPLWQEVRITRCSPPFISSFLPCATCRAARGDAGQDDEGKSVLPRWTNPILLTHPGCQSTS